MKLSILFSSITFVSIGGAASCFYTCPSLNNLLSTRVVLTLSVCKNLPTAMFIIACQDFNPSLQ